LTIYYFNKRVVLMT